MMIFERIFKNWKTTVGAVVLLGLFFWAYYEGLIPHEGLQSQISKLITGLVAAALVFSKDKKGDKPS